IAGVHEREAACPVNTPGLPTPTGAAPAALRLKPAAGAAVEHCCVDAEVVCADGLLERRNVAPVTGALYALVQGGVTLHYLVPQNQIDLEGLVGRQVSVVGSPVQGVSKNDSILEVGSVTAKE